MDCGLQCKRQVVCNYGDRCTEELSSHIVSYCGSPLPQEYLRLSREGVTSTIRIERVQASVEGHYGKERVGLMKRVVKPHVHCLDVPRELRRKSKSAAGA